MNRQEMDRKTNNTLRYLTRVQSHSIVKDEVIVDKFVKECLVEL